MLKNQKLFSAVLISVLMLTQGDAWGSRRNTNRRGGSRVARISRATSRGHSQRSARVARRTSARRTHIIGASLLRNGGRQQVISRNQRSNRRRMNSVQVAAVTIVRNRNRNGASRNIRNNRRNVRENVRIQPVLYRPQASQLVHNHAVYARPVSQDGQYGSLANSEPVSCSGGVCTIRPVAQPVQNIRGDQDYAMALQLEEYERGQTNPVNSQNHVPQVRPAAQRPSLAEQEQMAVQNLRDRLNFRDIPVPRDPQVATNRPTQAGTAVSDADQREINRLLAEDRAYNDALIAADAAFARSLQAADGQGVNAAPAAQGNGPAAQSEPEENAVGGDCVIGACPSQPVMMYVPCQNENCVTPVCRSCWDSYLQRGGHNCPTCRGEIARR